MGKKRNIRRRKTGGWAHTKSYPHKNHPANYRYVGNGNDDIEYLTFTHSREVVMPNGKTVITLPLCDNISIKERKENKNKNLKSYENPSYVFPMVYVGKRSALHQESKDFKPVSIDKWFIDFLFKVLPRRNITYTSNSKIKKPT